MPGLVQVFGQRASLFGAYIFINKHRCSKTRRKIEGHRDLAIAKVVVDEPRGEKPRNAAEHAEPNRKSHVRPVAFSP